MEDNILCIVGLTEIPGVQGKEIWMLATKRISGFKKELLICVARLLISKWVKEYGRLYKHIYILPSSITNGRNSFPFFFIFIGAKNIAPNLSSHRIEAELPVVLKMQIIVTFIKIWKITFSVL